MTQRIPPSIARLSPLLALLVFALVPYGWIAEANPWVQPFIYGLFATEAAHAVGHALIFALIAAALLRVFPELHERPLRFVALILLAGAAQEALQLLYKGRGLILNDFTDLGIDLVAAGVVLAIGREARRRARAGAAAVL